MSWTAPEVIRASRPDAFLEFQRSTLLVKCTGLTAEQLAGQAVPPSDLSLLSIVLRRAYNMMIEEYARHNGHADLLRQAIDGSAGI